MKVKPALATIIAAARIPREGQGLQSPTGYFRQVLLQWFDAESIGDRKFLYFARSVFCLDNVLGIACQKRRAGFEVAEINTGKITENRFVVRDLHCELMM